MATQLTKLQMEEISGVDSPANEQPGWLVMKSADTQGADNIEAGAAALYSTLAAADQFLTAAPDEIAKAKDTLATYCETLLLDPEPRVTLADKVRGIFTKNAATVAGEDSEDDFSDTLFDDELVDGTTSTETVTDAVAPSEDIEVLKEVVGKLADQVAAITKALTGSTAISGQDTQDEGVEKSAPTLRDAIVSAARGSRVTLS